MPNSFEKLWVFGDSHSTPNMCVEPDQSFWGLAATELAVKHVVNCSRPALSFDSVCHLLVGEQQQYDYDRDFFIIGIPPLERITIFDDYKDTTFKSWSFDLPGWNLQRTKMLSHNGLINLQYKDLDKVWIMMSDRAWLETQVLRQIFLITQWLDQQHAQYMIINLSKNLDPANHWGPSQFILDYCKNHQRCQLFDGSLYNCNLGTHFPADFDHYGWYGHHDSNGNRHFFDTTVRKKLC